MENNRRIRIAGILYTIGGVLWLGWILGWSLLVNFTISPGSPYFYFSEIGYIILQILMFVGFLGVWWSHGVGDSLFGKIAFALGLLGHFLFVVAELYSVVAGSEDLLPVAAMTSAIGFLLTGIAVLRAGQWRGWSRYAPLLAGIYPFVGMFPFLILTDQPSFWGIALWGIFRIMLGLAIYEQAKAPAPNRSEQTSHALGTGRV